MNKKSQSTKEKYNRNAHRYDLMELFPETFFLGRFRKKLFAHVRGKKILEVGVGTGKNIPYYPKEIAVTAIDFSEEMMKRAHKKANELHSTVDLQMMDIESMQFESNSFDAVIATFVFCSVPDPIRGLKEVRRVLTPAGHFYATEHVRPYSLFFGKLFDTLAPFVERRTGVNINRNTINNIRIAGFDIERETNLLFDIFKFIIAQPALKDKHAA
jgi:ubiquinone/menaquinone biosynthesis C-methylase UbiE